MALERQARRRPLSLTSLIDVIFLLLLFFMLTSSFSRFSGLELPVSARDQGLPSDNPTLFLRASSDTVTLNGRPTTLAALGSEITQARKGQPVTVIASFGNGASAQRLVDVLAALRGLVGVSLHVVGRV